MDSEKRLEVCQGGSYINLLEIRAIHRLIRDLLGLGPSYRVVAMVDSYVTRGAVSKGRSSSKTISALLRDDRCGADPGWHLPCHSNYLPTRYNCSDDPTRCRSLRSSLVCMVLCNFSEEDLYKLGLLKGTRRWASNWVRPCLVLVGWVEGPAFPLQLFFSCPHIATLGSLCSLCGLAFPHLAASGVCVHFGLVLQACQATFSCLLACLPPPLILLLCWPFLSLRSRSRFEDAECIWET